MFTRLLSLEHLAQSLMISMVTHRVLIYPLLILVRLAVSQITTNPTEQELIKLVLVIKELAGTMQE